jgi:agmatinase
MDALMTAHFLDLPAEFRDPATAAFSIIPVPYDLTSTYKKGADRGPAAMIEASSQVELYDIPTRCEPYRRGVLTIDPIVFDGTPDALADRVQEVVAQELQQGRIPVCLGGEHSITIGAMRAAAATSNRFSVLQIDAHGDTRDSYHGSKCNHACVMARAMELGTVAQVGIRAIDGEEINNMDESRVFYAHDIHAQRDDAWMQRVVDQLEDDVYLTIDLDAFDSSIFPATGTPEPGGLDWYTVNNLIAHVASKRNIMAFDVVELLPTDQHWACDFLAAKLVYRVMSMILHTRK